MRTGVICGADLLSVGRVLELLTATDPGLIKRDEAKSDQLLGLTNNSLLFIRSQIPIAKKLLKSCE